MTKRKPHTHAKKPRSGGRDRKGAPRASSGGGYWLYGIHAALAALGNPKREVLDLCVTPGFAENHPETVEKAGARVIERADLDALLPEAAVHQGIALRVKPLVFVDSWDVLGTAPAQGKQCVAILDQATDPRNVGAVLRSAAAFGIKCVIIQDRYAPPETGALAKAASGALEHVPLVRVTNLAREMDDLKSAGFWCIGLDGHTDMALRDTRLDGPTAFVLGAEGKGLRRLTREKCDVLVRIPLSEAVESLNLANAASIAFYEWAR